MAKKSGWQQQQGKERTNEHTTNAQPKPSTRKSWWTNAEPKDFTKRAEREIKS